MKPVPLDSTDSRAHRRQIAQALNAILRTVAASPLTERADGDYQISNDDETVLLTGALVLPRTFTLPALSPTMNGRRIWVADGAGGVNATNTLTLACGGSDTINGASTKVMSTPYGACLLVGNFTNSNWYAKAF